LKLRERPSYPALLQQMKPGAIILNQRQKGKPWNGTILNLLKKIKIKKYSSRQIVIRGAQIPVAGCCGN